MEGIKRGIKEFLDFLYHKQTGYFFLATKGKGTAYTQKVFRKHETDKAAELVMESTFYNVYTSLNCFTHPARRKEYCAYTDNIFLDFDRTDMYEDFLSEYLGYTTVIETSSGKYQVYLKLPEPVESQKVEIVSKYLSRLYMSDNTYDVTRMVRIPNTYNHKYTPPHITKIIIESNICLPLSVFEDILKKAKTTPDFGNGGNGVLPRIEDISSQEIENAIKNYQIALEYAPEKPTGEKDYSVADMRFAVYMLKKGHSPAKVAAMLLSVSPRLTERKGEKYIDTYIYRTVQKAACYCHTQQK